MANYDPLLLLDPSEESSAPIDNLPVEVLVIICQFLQKSDLISLRNVSHKFLSVTRNFVRPVYRVQKISKKFLQEIPDSPNVLLDLSECAHQVDDAVISALSRNISQLDLSRCHNVTFEGLRHLPQLLVHLNLTGCIGIEMVELPKTLTFLSLAKTSIALNGILSLGLPNLETLDLSDCHKITDQALLYLPAKIQNLYLNYTPVTPIGIQYLKRYPDLYKLELRGFVSIDNSIADDLPKVNLLNFTS